MQILQQLMLPQFAFGAVETAFNTLLNRSLHTSAILRKLAGKILEIQLTSPNLHFFILFGESRTDWLGQYEGETDCSVTLQASVLPKLADKTQLSKLINDKSLVLNGDLQLLQHFSTLLDELEKDPAELLSPLIGDVASQALTNLGRGIFNQVKQQFSQNSRHLAENLMNERPVLVHRLQVADFCDQVAELEKQAMHLEEKFAKLR